MRDTKKFIIDLEHFIVFKYVLKVFYSCKVNRYTLSLLNYMYFRNYSTVREKKIQLNLCFVNDNSENLKNSLFLNRFILSPLN